MIELSNLEIHAWHGCNITCESCAHYSPLGIRGGPSAAECGTWMEKWSNRLQPKVFSIVGGEPTLNKELSGVLERAIEYWPTSKIRLVTNGFLLSRHPELPTIMAKASERVFLEISVHHDSIEYEARFQKVRKLVGEWRSKYDVDIKINQSYKRWTRRYHVNTNKVEFFESAPRVAWEACVGKRCKQLFDGRIWKCPPVAYFRLLKPAIRQNRKDDDLLMSYKPLEPDCDNDTLKQFFALEDEPICRICPEVPESFVFPNPLSGRRVWQER